MPLTIPWGWPQIRLVAAYMRADVNAADQTSFNLTVEPREGG